MLADIREPRDNERLAIFGMTGTGKTTAGLYHLSLRSFDVKPWVIFDFKGDEHLGRIEGAQSLKRGSRAPTEPGIYIARPIPGSDDEWVESLLNSIHARGNIGVFIDEGYMIDPRSKAFSMILTQGRSLKIPTIVLSQRPVWMNRFGVSESEFKQVFFLADEEDRDMVKRFIPHDMKSRKLPRFHSYYYYVPLDEFEGLRPLPSADESIEVINERLEELHAEGPSTRLVLSRPYYFI